MKDGKGTWNQSLKKESSSFVFWINFCLCMSDSIVSGIAVE